jgi:hypothetical protein
METNYYDNIRVIDALGINDSEEEIRNIMKIL